MTRSSFYSQSPLRPDRYCSASCGTMPLGHISAKWYLASGSISTIHGARCVKVQRSSFRSSEQPQGAAIEDRTLIDLLSTAIDVIVHVPDLR